jgi:hypothetical protein
VASWRPPVPWGAHFVWWRSEFRCKTPNHLREGRSTCNSLRPDALAFVTWIRSSSLFGSLSLLYSTDTLIPESEARLEPQIYNGVNIDVPHPWNSGAELCDHPEALKEPLRLEQVSSWLCKPVYNAKIHLLHSLLVVTVDVEAMASA